ncbi:MAG TPA: molybdenum cofactor guanylyltransferase [Bacteroidia bacterium]|nr:molybdenum cofactor guanylyltransferase [Bacteroidia bacterium]
MANERNNVNGYILAGGKSSRMGTDKGLLPLNGSTIVGNIIRQLEPAVGKITIVANSSRYEQFGVEVIADIIPGIGPSGGIHAALHHSDRAHNFIVSCDMPFITTEAIQTIIVRPALTEITLPFYQQQLEPLFGLYSKNCLDKWQELIRQHIFKLKDMITYFSVKRIDIDHNPLFQNTLFMNVNTPADFEAAKKIEHGNSASFIRTIG